MRGTYISLFWAGNILCDGTDDALVGSHTSLPSRILLHQLLYSRGLTAPVRQPEVPQSQTTFCCFCDRLAVWLFSLRGSSWIFSGKVGVDVACSPLVSSTSWARNVLHESFASLSTKTPTSRSHFFTVLWHIGGMSKEVKKLLIWVSPTPACSIPEEVNSKWIVTYCC